MAVAFPRWHTLRLFKFCLVVGACLLASALVFVLLSDERMLIPGDRRASMLSPSHDDERTRFHASTTHMTGPRFAYLTVMKNTLDEPGSYGLPAYGDYRDAASGPDSVVIMTNWKEQSEGTLFFGNGSSFGRNRNNVLMEALRRERCTGWKPLYYIFLDDNNGKLDFVKPDPAYTVVNETIAVDASTGEVIGSPLRVFERFLLEWEPAVGVVWYGWQHEDGELVNSLQNTDHCFYAIHREAARVLLPYADYFDDNHWWYSNHLINHMNTVFFNNFRHQYTALRLFKVAHTSAVRQMGFLCETDWSVMGSFLFDSLRADSPLRKRVRMEPDTWNCATYDGEGTPTRKGSRRYDGDGWEDHIDVTHPLWATNRAFWRHHDYCASEGASGPACGCDPVMVRTPCERKPIPCEINSTHVKNACVESVCEIGC